MAAATSVRLQKRQKRALDQAARILERRLGRRLTQGEAVEALSRTVTENQALLDQAWEPPDLDLSKDPLFDTQFRFNMGRTNARRLDEILYGKERRK